MTANVTNLSDAQLLRRSEEITDRAEVALIEAVPDLIGYAVVMFLKEERNGQTGASVHVSYGLDKEAPPESQLVSIVSKTLQDAVDKI